MKSVGAERGELLLEIGCEEIPAGLIVRASEQLRENLEKQLAGSRLIGVCDGRRGNGGGAPRAVESFGAPRRLVAIARGIKAMQEDVVEEVTGPPKSIGYDAVGAPTRAALSFAEKQGISVEQISIVKTAKGEYLAAKKTTRGRAAKDLLAEMLPVAIGSIAFPRSMYWTHPGDIRFIRPIRWVLALFDGKAVKFTVGDVESGAHTSGHRFLGREEIRVGAVADYEKELRKNFVMARPEERRAKIEKELAAACGAGLRVRADAELMEQVVYLNEYPTVLRGNFDAAYLELPAEILVTVMRDHQKYFAVEDEAGKLRAYFLAVINLDKDRKGLIQAGHEKVLRARFEDARFFWDTDQKKWLGEYREKLKSVTFESRLGSYHAKVERVRALTEWLASEWNKQGKDVEPETANRAAAFAKCDLVTEMVHEFPELQGVVGGLYARVQNEPESVWRAIYDQYRPAGIEDKVPGNLTGCALALADKLDTLVGCFAVGAIPTGSSDPFALRRAAIGIVQIVLTRNLTVSLGAAIKLAADRYAHSDPVIAVSEKAQSEVLTFIAERCRYVLRETGYLVHNEEITAVLAVSADDLLDVRARLDGLISAHWGGTFNALSAAFKRVKNILAKSAGMSKAQGTNQPMVNPDLFREDAERKLYEVARKISEASEKHRRHKEYELALKQIALLRPAVDEFFEKVLVMAPEEDVRGNRLALLGSLLREFSSIADLSEITMEDAARK